MSRVLLDRNRHDRRFLFDSLAMLGLAALFGGFASALRPAAAQAIEWTIPAIFAALAAGFVFLGVWHYFGRERIVVEAGYVEASRCLGPFTRRLCVRLEDVIGIDVPARGREFVNGSWGVGKPSLLVRTRQGVLRCCVGIAPSEAERVGAELWEAVQNVGTGHPTLGSR